jgi:hypothetical protein
MKNAKSGGLAGLTALCATVLLCGVSFAADVPATQPISANVQDQAPEVPPAKPGVFTATKKGATGYHLVVAGHKFISRNDIEKYLAWRAADLTMAQKASWFTFVEARAKGDSAPVPKRDPGGLRYSFRMDYFRPVWRYKVTGSPAWKSWSPFAGAAFITDDPKNITDFQVSADIVLHKGRMDDANPLAFEAGAVSDLLINQVSPPE